MHLLNSETFMGGWVTDRMSRGCKEIVRFSSRVGQRDLNVGHIVALAPSQQAFTDLLRVDHAAVSAQFVARKYCE
jgi:hypothetical protein